MTIRVALEDVEVRLGRRSILKGLTWEVPTDGRTLLLGRNGAGKTTTLRTICGALKPRRGKVNVGSSHVSSSTLRRLVAMMPQNILGVPGLSVAEQVSFAAWLGGLSEKEARTAASRALEAVDLAEMRGRRPSTLSGGELRRVGLAEVLARPSEVLLLDEPTAGLDPTQRARFRELLVAIDRPVVVSTHQLDDVDDLFTSVAVLEGGHIVYSGTTAEFLDHGYGRDTARKAETAFMELTGSV